MSRARRLLLATSALVPLLAAGAAAGPQGPSVVGGSATVQGAGTANTVVSQSSQKAIINWHLFNIGAGETTTFNTPGASAVTLNRVTGGMGPSQILGTLTSNGQVFIVNRDGFVFGAGAVVNSAGLLATTHDIKNEDFMAGRYNFDIKGRPDASIVNLGTITAHSGGFAALVAPGVRNAGTITATLGNVGLAASGTGFELALDPYGDKLIRLGVSDHVAGQVIDVATGQPLSALVTNTGTLSANGGKVEITAAAARHIVDSVINTSGVIEADTVGTKGGQIILGAATEATKGAGAPQQTVKVSGKLSAAGKNGSEKGGKVQVTGEHIRVAGATLDASGRAGGGTVLIGGDWGGGNPDAGLVNNPSARLERSAIATATSVSVDAATTIDASATESGNGGKVVLWANNDMSFAGGILARGGAGLGAGGFAEVSGQKLDFRGTANLGATNGAAGTLLLDPLDFYITSVLGSAPSGASEMTNTQINTLLATQHLVIATDNESSAPGQKGDIFVNAPIAWNSVFTLTLSAYRDVVVNATIANGNADNPASGNLVLRADNTGSGTGTVKFIDGHVDFTHSAGKVSIFYNPAVPAGEVYPYTDNKYDYAINYAPYVTVSPDGELTGYMLVNSVDDLRLIGSAYSTYNRNFALGRNIDGGNQAFEPIAGSFDGRFNGLDQTISNLQISSTESWNVGLFSSIGGGGSVQNLKLDNIKVTGTGNAQFLGTLAGFNSGTIANVTVGPTSSVETGSWYGATAGGLVGVNAGAIMKSKSAAAVSATGENGYALAMGGLVGWNFGQISDSVANGSVTGNALFIGGFAGASAGWYDYNDNDGGPYAGYMVGPSFQSEYSAGTITNSYATGAVTGGLEALAIGGFVGANAGTIDKAFATGAVTGGDGSIVGGFAAINLPEFGIGTGVITHSYAIGAVTGGAGSVVAGFVAYNSGTLDQTYAAGKVTGGAGSLTGGLVAVNSYGGEIDYSYVDEPNNHGTGTVTNSYWDTQRTGQAWSAAGTGLTTAQLTSGLPTGFVSGEPWTQQPSSYPCLAGICNPIPAPDGPPPNDPPHDQQADHNDPIVPPPLVLASNDPTPQQPQEVINQIITASPPATPPSGGPQQPRRISGVPPRNETRFINNEVVLQLGNNITPEQLAAVAKELGIEVIASENVGLLARTVYRFRITNGKSVSDIIRALESKNITAFAQPNYVYTLAQGTSGPAAAQKPAETSGQETASVSHRHGEDEQYTITKLRLNETHALSRGSNVLVAVIDSAVDPDHPDLKDAIVDRLNTIEGEVKPHMHGTGMAGAIASQRRLLGVAPRSRLLTISAFGGKAQTAESTSMQIVKGLNWAVEKGARVINMSFAGPQDPILSQAIKTMHNRGIVMIAAAGNAGPGSPPLFPAADPNVIAVTATDVKDKVFARANRGKHIALAAPGVDVLVPAPEGSYQLTTGTSVAAAHISGVAALLLERNPNLKPADIRRVLVGTARKQVGIKPEDIGSGLVDPYQALQRSGRSAGVN